MTLRLFKRGWPALAVVALLALVGASMAFTVTTRQARAVSGAAFTTINQSYDNGDYCLNGSGTTNCNIYTGKNYVWLTGGPSTAALADGTYFFAVLDPGGQQDPNDGTAGNLSTSDSYQNRTFTISGGAITYPFGSNSATHIFDSNLIRLMPYDNTSNPGGEYVLAICQLAADGTGTPVTPSACKYDNFKVASGTPAKALTISKTAAGVYTTTYGWTIDKSVSPVRVEQVGGSVTATYTIHLTHDNGANSGITVSGTITVSNPNAAQVQITSVTDQLSDGTACTVTGGGAQTINPGDTTFPYTCNLSTAPTTIDNIATVTWPDQILSDASWLTGGTATYTFSSVPFTQTVVNNCVNVTDSFNSATPAHLGSFCVDGTYTKDINLGTTAYANLSVSYSAPTFTLTYSRTIAVPQWNCVTSNNTVTITETGQTASAAITLCGPAKTGALTMGFWQNKNGQGIITSGSSTNGVCNLTTWLRQYNPFSDLSATATCSQAAAYVYTIIKAANASGSSMNAMLKAQMLATALDVFYSDPANGNKIGAPAPIGGVTIDLTRVCVMIDSSGGAATCGGSYWDVSAAFGGAPSMTVSAMLTYAAGQSNAGGTSWYGQVKATQQLAKDAFDAINNQVAFSAA